MAGQAQEGEAERRTGERIQTHHHVVFSESRALGPLRTGVAVDRSSGGLRILTPHPEPLGTTLQIELRASADSASVLLLEGRVAHITPAEKGLHAMGIRLVQPALRAGAPLPPHEKRAPLVIAATRGTSAVPGASPMPPMGIAPDLEMSEAVTFRRIEDGGRPGSWAALILILVLVVILVLLIVEVMRDRDRSASEGFFHWFREDTVLAAESARASVLANPGSPEDAGSEGRSPSPSLAVEARRPGDMQPHALASVTPAIGAPQLLGDPADATMLAGAPPEVRGAAPLSASGFEAMLEYADRASARGETGLARVVVRRALARSGGVPAAWVELAGDYRDSLGAASAGAPEYPLRAAISLEAADDPSRPRDDMRIEVDASDHLMRVSRGAQTLAEFPVGLGQDGATPSGTFRIGTKARNPAWYHDGRVVPADDPNNPIGEQWMGLAQDGARTGIGIHPTAQPASIGADQSLGCVRMRPKDAEALYRLVPLGATVTIRP